MTRHYQALGGDKQEHFRKNFKGLRDGWRKPCWPQDDSEKCRTAVGRESRRRLKLIKTQNEKYSGQVVKMQDRYEGKAWSRIKFSLAIKCMNRMQRRWNDASLWLEMGKRWWWHSCFDWQQGGTEDLKENITLFLNLQLTWDLHRNSSYVQGNVNQECEQAKGKLHLYFKVLDTMWGQHLLSKLAAASLLS